MISDIAETVRLSLYDEKYSSKDLNILENKFFTNIACLKVIFEDWVYLLHDLLAESLNRSSYEFFDLFVLSASSYDA